MMKLIRLEKIDDIAKKYGLSRRATLRRIERNHIQGYQIGDLTCYELSEELERILSTTSKGTRKKRYELVDDFSRDLFFTVEGKIR